MNYEHFTHHATDTRKEKNIFLVNMNREEQWNYSELLQKGIQKTLHRQ